MQNGSDLSLLVGEYEGVVEDIGVDTAEAALEDERLAAYLVSSSEWTTPAARTLVELVRVHGSFMLRNAAALAIALRHEDGELGY